MMIHFFFFFNDTATTEIYTLSLHDALPILALAQSSRVPSGLQSYVIEQRPEITRLSEMVREAKGPVLTDEYMGDRKSTRLNSSHANISYAVFCLKKKKNNQ